MTEHILIYPDQTRLLSPVAVKQGEEETPAKKTPVSVSGNHGRRRASNCVVKVRAVRHVSLD